MRSNIKTRAISIALVLISLITAIGIKGWSVQASAATEPYFSIENYKVTPNPTDVGGDIEISGTIVPTDFEATVPTKEIVLVLDVSGSMDSDYITGRRAGARGRQRLDKLKEATNTFIDKMNGVANLKIGIVSFGATAKVEQGMTDISNSSVLKSKINSLSVIGGTNPREGVRKAAYLLNNGNSANKTIVLMTDGGPTGYSQTNKIDDVSYNDIITPDPNKTTPEVMTHTEDFFRNYISKNNYNTYSIGYCLDSETKGYLKRLHLAMKDLPSNTNIDAKNGFFEDASNLQQIFTDIADKIKDGYNLTDISLNITLMKNFNMNIGNNQVKMPDIFYKKQSISGNKTIYHADPVDFKFTVKATKDGAAQHILRQIQFNYLFEGNKKMQVFDKDLQIDVYPKETPNISATLTSLKDIKIKKDDEVTVKYEIKPEDFDWKTTTTSSSGKADIVIVMEKGTGNLGVLKPAIINSILNSLMQNPEINPHYSIITFDGQGPTTVLGLADKWTGDYRSFIQTKVESINDGTYAESSGKDITAALQAADNMFKGARADASKNLIIFSNQDIKYDNNKISAIKNSAYNVQTLNITRDGQSKTTNLDTVHNLLGGLSANKYSVGNDMNSINNGGNSYGIQIKDKIVNNTLAKPYTFDPVIKVELGNDFIPISSNITKNTVNGKTIGEVKIPTVIYNLVQGSTNKYHANPQTIEFKVKGNNLNPGTHNFGDLSNNTINYESLLNKPVVKGIETPVINVEQEVKDLVHGIIGANGTLTDIVDKDPNGQNYKYKVGDAVNFATKFTMSGSSINVDLNVDKEFEQLDVTKDIMTSRVTKNPGDKDIDQKDVSIKSNGNNNYTISINNLDPKVDNEILITYRATIKSTTTSKSLTNTVKVGKLSKDVTVDVDQDTITNLSHGMYNGFDGTNVNIDEGNNKTFNILVGSTANFAARFTATGTIAKLDLDIDDKNLNHIGLDNIKVYDIKKDSLGKITDVKEIEIKDVEKTNNGKDNNYSIKVNNVTPNSDLMVVYKIQNKNEGTSSISTAKNTNSNLSESITINNVNGSNGSNGNGNNNNGNVNLPDLF